MGARVGITGRDKARTARAAAEIADESGSTDVDVFVADMSSQAEVRRLAGEILAAYQRRKENARSDQTSNQDPSRRRGPGKSSSPSARPYRRGHHPNWPPRRST